MGPPASEPGKCPDAFTRIRDGLSRKSAEEIIHHFGSKEDLYDSVKRRVVEGYAARFPAAAREIDKPINLRWTDGVTQSEAESRKRNS